MESEAGKINLHRVIHHQVHGHKRLDELGILAQPGDGAAHGGEVHEQRHTGEILQHDARDDEGDFLGARARGCQWASARTAASLTRLPSQLRRTDSSTRRMETGSLEIGPRPVFSSAGSE